MATDFKNFKHFDPYNLCIHVTKPLPKNYLVNHKLQQALNNEENYNYSLQIETQKNSQLILYYTQQPAPTEKK